MSEHLNRVACNTCRRRSDPQDGRMNCLYDPAAPVDVQERLKARFCPAGRFPASDEAVEIAREADRTAGPCCGG